MINKSKGLKIEVGPHWTISSIPNGGVPNKEVKVKGERSAWFAPWLEKFRDGSLLLGFGLEADNPYRAPSGHTMMLYSEDNSDTWWFDSLPSHGIATPFEARDGMRYLFGVHYGRDAHYPVLQRDLKALKKMRERSPFSWEGIDFDFVTPRYLSYDGGQSWEGPESVYLHIPEAKGAGFYARRIVELSNGKLITAIHLTFKNEEKSRVIIISSEDKGRYWEYLSTVAYDPDIETEGFTEPVLLQLASGELLCVMRTQGFHPIMQSFSRDSGKSWSAPVKTGVDGVWPDLCLMQSGIVACAYGRPGCNVMFSLDGTAREWSHQTEIIPPVSSYSEREKQGTWGKGYNSVREIRPGELLYVYNLCRHPQDWHGGALPTYEELLKDDLPTLNSIRATIIKVQRKKDTGK